MLTKSNFVISTVLTQKIYIKLRNLASSHTDLQAGILSRNSISHFEAFLSHVILFGSVNIYSSKQELHTLISLHIFKELIFIVPISGT